jgi:anthranilate phosphoribosyltransferase
MILRDLLRVLGSSDRREGRNLTHDEAYRAFLTILDGHESEVRIGAFLIALRWKGLTVEEVTGFARAARERANIPCQKVSGLVCVCPPHDGYDVVPPLEVAAGIVAAGAGARVMLVCDRGVPPRRGLTAAHVLEHLRLPLCWDPEACERTVVSTGFGAMAAPGMLPALLALRRVRGDVGVRTPLSTIEKLITPSACSILLGSQHGAVLGLAAGTMAGLGHPSGIAIQGQGGGVIPSLSRRTRGVEIDGQHQVPLSVEPSDFGLSSTENPELPIYGPGEDNQGPGDNPALVRAAGEMSQAVLDGEPGPARNATLLGAALILKAARRVPTLAEGLDVAQKSLDSGAARKVVSRLRAESV